MERLDTALKNRLQLAEDFAGRVGQARTDLERDLADRDRENERTFIHSTETCHLGQSRGLLRGSWSLCAVSE